MREAKHKRPRATSFHWRSSLEKVKPLSELSDEYRQVPEVGTGGGWLRRGLRRRVEGMDFSMLIVVLAKRIYVTKTHQTVHFRLNLLQENSTSINLTLHHESSGPVGQVMEKYRRVSGKALASRPL